MEDPIQPTEDITASSYKPNTYIVFTALVGVVAVGVLVIAFLVSLSGDTAGERYPKVYFLLAASVLGSLVNQPFRDKEDNKGKRPTLLILYLAWKCAIASVFAIVVNLVFISGVISGELFPRFSGTGLPYFDMMHWAVSVDPQTNADMAKMLVWSFVAGFSEKLVPNMVTKIFVAPE
jgi:FtsH-binding integral membrane protein